MAKPAKKKKPEPVYGSQIEAELLELTGISYTEGEEEGEYLYRILDAAAELADSDEFEAMSEEAQLWVQEASTAYNNEEDIPLFEDAEVEEEQAEEAVLDEDLAEELEGQEEDAESAIEEPEDDDDEAAEEGGDEDGEVDTEYEEGEGEEGEGDEGEPEPGEPDADEDEIQEEEVAPKKPARRGVQGKMPEETRKRRSGEVKGKGLMPAKFPVDHVIHLLVDKNPKRVGTASYDRFELYKDGMTIQQFLEAGGSRGDLRWDTDRESIAIVAPGAAKPAPRSSAKPAATGKKKPAPAAKPAAKPASKPAARRGK